MAQSSCGSSAKSLTDCGNRLGLRNIGCVIVGWDNLRGEKNCLLFYDTRNNLSDGAEIEKPFWSSSGFNNS